MRGGEREGKKGEEMSKIEGPFPLNGARQHDINQEENKGKGKRAEQTPWEETRQRVRTYEQA